MPRAARLFDSSSGSVVRGFLMLHANITPRWIENARSSRKHIEPEIDKSFRKLSRLSKNRPGAKVMIRNATKELKAVLKLAMIGG
jgi:hypothetical protein